jgi:hypothetical protein
MSNLVFSCDWLSSGKDIAHLRETAGQLTIRLGDVNLTKNEDIWSKTVRDSVLVSAYPLAIWLAASWWRLSYEPLPRQRMPPTLDWRMSHEMGAANSGFVWPYVVMASDGEAVQTWALPSDASSTQSVRYLAGLPAPRAVLLEEFQQSVSDFIEMVLSRLRSVGCVDTDLAGLWSLVLEDQADSDASKARRLEAQMGYDPDECPPLAMAEALALEKELGMSALSELTPVFGRRPDGAALSEISRLAGIAGLQGKPEKGLTRLAGTRLTEPPWQRAVETARGLRTKLGNEGSPLDDVSLYGLLGLTSEAVAKWAPPTRHQVGLAVPLENRVLKFVSRKQHPIAKRFEFARFLGDYVNGEPKRWLASTDLATSRQKFQRAFAAEFLCPIESLAKFLGGDYSEPAIEEAATQFRVSEKTVESLLANNGYVAPPFDDGYLPYRLVA